MPPLITAEGDEGGSGAIFSNPVYHAVRDGQNLDGQYRIGGRLTGRSVIVCIHLRTIPEVPSTPRSGSMTRSTLSRWLD